MIKTFSKFSKYLIATIIGCLLIGIGCGITAIEFTQFTTQDFTNDTPATNLSGLDWSEETLMLPIHLSDSHKTINIHSSDLLPEILIDDQLDNQVKINIALPANLYQNTQYYYFDEENNTFQLYWDTNPFAMSKFFLDHLKGDTVVTPPQPQLTISLPQQAVENFLYNDSVPLTTINNVSSPAVENSIQTGEQELQ